MQNLFQLVGKPPKQYIAGAGCGAVGFTTRSDIGPARQAVVPIDRPISAEKERSLRHILYVPLRSNPCPDAQMWMPMHMHSLATTNHKGPMPSATPSELVVEEEKQKGLEKEKINDFLLSTGSYDD